MHNDNFSRLQALGAKSFNQATTIESKPIGTELEVKKPDAIALERATIHDGAMFLIPLGLIMFWAILAFRVSKIASRFANITFSRLPNNREIPEDEIEMVKHFNQLPCRNCRYFSNNPYLRCAVQPANALTQQALDCADYSARNKSFDSQP